MNFSSYIFNQGLEKLVIETSKELIRNDRTIPVQQRKDMIAVIDICSTAKDIREFIQMTR